MATKATLKRYSGLQFVEFYPKTTHDQIIASGSPSNTTFLRGDGVWATPISGTGDVVGPASSVDNRIAVFNGTTGKLIKDSGVLISGLALSSHTHAIADVIGLGTALNSKLNLSGGTLTGVLNFSGAATHIKLQEDHFVFRRFNNPEAVVNNNTAYILLCRNAANNDVNGTITMDRTSGLRHASTADILISAGTGTTPVGTMRSMSTSGSGQPSYRLVTLTYSGNSHIALQINNPDNYYDTSGMYFTGRIKTTDVANEFRVVATTSVSAILNFGINESHQINGDKVFTDGYRPNADTLTTARNIALTGSVTGNANFDGSGNISITTTTAHNHDDRYYTETELNNGQLDNRYFTETEATANFEPKNANIQTHISATNNPHSVTKTQVGLGNVNNTSDAAKPVSTAQQTALNLKLNTSARGAANGVASLDANSKILVAQLPNSVFDSLYFYNVIDDNYTLIEMFANAEGDQSLVTSRSLLGIYWVATDQYTLTANSTATQFFGVFYRTFFSPGEEGEYSPTSQTLETGDWIVVTDITGGNGSTSALAINVTFAVVNNTYELASNLVDGIVKLSSITSVNSSTTGSQVITQGVLGGLIGTTNTKIAAGSHTHAAGDVTSGTLAVARGGTGQTTLALARNAMGLGNTTGALPIANGGTGAADASTARTNLGLGNVNNTSDAAKPVSTAQQTALNLKLNTSARGAANGVASLDANSKILFSQLPNEVFDNLQFGAVIAGSGANPTDPGSFASSLHFNQPSGRNLVGIYFVASGASFTIANQTTAVQALGSTTFWRWTFKSNDPNVISTQPPVGSDTLESGDWVVVEKFTGLGTSANPYVVEFGVVNNTYEIATTAIHGITQLSSITSVNSSTTGSQVITQGVLGGLIGNVLNFGIASQAEAEAGTSNEKYMTPLRTAQAIIDGGTF